MDQRLEMGSVETRTEGEELVIAARGDWTLRAVPDLDHRMAAIKPQGARRAKLDLSADQRDRQRRRLAHLAHPGQPGESRAEGDHRGRRSRRMRP